MPHSYLNIPYVLDEAEAVPETRFHSIWKVEANDSYQVFQTEGFSDPGMFVTYDGHGTLQVSGGGEGESASYDMSAHSFLFVDRNLPCEYWCNPGDRWCFYFIHFSDLGMVNDLHLSPGNLQRTEMMPYLVHLCEKMIEALIVREQAYAHTVNQWFRDMLLTLAREKNGRGAKEDPAVARALYWMHQNIDKPLRITELVDMANMSRTRFFNRFKFVTGRTPTDYFLQLKLESAKVTLQTTTLPVKTISAALHFYDEYYFSKLFKKHFGVPPSAFRSLAGQQVSRESQE